MKISLFIAIVSFTLQGCASVPVNKTVRNSGSSSHINVSGFNNKASTVEIKKNREDKYAQKLAILKQRNPDRDAQREISRGNYFLLAYQTGRGGGASAPGLTIRQMESSSCRNKQLEGFGDTIYGDSHLRYRIALRAYAKEFNKLMYNYCGRSRASYLKIR